MGYDHACVAAYSGDEVPLQNMLRAIITPINTSVDT